MWTIDEAIPVAAVPLVARAMLEAPERPVSQKTLIFASGEKLDYDAALRTLVLRRLVLVERDGYKPVPGGEKPLGYYANSTYRR